MYDMQRSGFRSYCALEVSPDGKFLNASCSVGDRTFSRRWDLKSVVDSVWKKLQEIGQIPSDVSASGVELAGLGDLYRSATSAARRIVESRAVSDLKRKVVKISPYVREAAELIPYAGSVVKAVKIAEKIRVLVVAAKRGSSEAKSKITAIRRLADQGDPKAEAAIDAARFLNDRLSVSPSPSVSGWGYNVPYRSNFSAMELDPKNPKHVARGIYNRGIA